jgi:hypothetical protein
MMSSHNANLKAQREIDRYVSMKYRIYKYNNYEIK